MTIRSTFDDLVADLDYPMYIVTAAAAGERGGCLVGFATQTSVEPSRFLACLSRNNRTFTVASRAQVLIVHLVPRQAEDLAVLFGGQTGQEVDKFARCDWRQGPGGAPLLERCPSWFAGRVLTLADLGDHVGFLLDPYACEVGADQRHLTFARAKHIEAAQDA